MPYFRKEDNGWVMRNDTGHFLSSYFTHWNDLLEWYITTQKES